MSQNPFDDLTDVYESMIDFDKRLAHEAPFYRGVFAGIGAKSVLDVACGTGHHAAMFRSWGLRVEGADISPAMLDRARARHGESADLKWTLRGFDAAVEPAGAFDAAICVGNSLALAPDRGTASLAVRRMLEAIRPGGAIIIHVLNVWKLPDGPTVWQKSRRARMHETDVLIHKGIHRGGERGFVDLLVTPVDNPAGLRADCVAFLGIDPDWLVEQARTAGAGSCEVLGDYQSRAYRREQSQDLIMVGRK